MLSRYARCQHTLQKAAVTNGFGSWLFLRTTRLAAARARSAHPKIRTSPLPSPLLGEKPHTAVSAEIAGLLSVFPGGAEPTCIRVQDQSRCKPFGTRHSQRETRNLHLPMCPRSMCSKHAAFTHCCTGGCGYNALQCSSSQQTKTPIASSTSHPPQKAPTATRAPAEEGFLQPAGVAT